MVSRGPSRVGPWPKEAERSGRAELHHLTQTKQLHETSNKQTLETNKHYMKQTLEATT